MICLVMVATTTVLRMGLTVVVGITPMEVREAGDGTTPKGVPVGPERG